MPLVRKTFWVTILTLGEWEKEVDRYRSAYVSVSKGEYAVFTFEPPRTENWLVFEVPTSQHSTFPRSCDKFVATILLMLISPYHRAARGLNVAAINGHRTFNCDGSRTNSGVSVILVDNEQDEGLPQWSRLPLSPTCEGSDTRNIPAEESDSRPSPVTQEDCNAVEQRIEPIAWDPVRNRELNWPC
ncbi:uncharacterized protein LDX57_012697 [Aspergillus melleus]|uniref:uncharacterized protein n=1 Tax=Aspergillus melleus TaxID=138277 RepID=UPI001E8CAA94|nr:uncharacterized protein LDX57_012697 [Aspergillus melleus]KAH8435068.1 hypothetical protein LDX57_012697 [Aspergillus melleus]